MERNLRFKIDTDSLVLIFVFLSGIFYFNSLGFFFLTIFLCLMIGKSTIILSLDLFDYLLIAYSALYIYYGRELSTIFSQGMLIKNAILPLVFYMIIVKNSRYDISYFKNTLLAFSMGCLSTNLLSSIGYNRISQYMVPIIWDKTSMVNPVNLNMYSLIASSAIFYAIVLEKDVVQKYAWTICGLLGLYITIRTSKYSVLLAVAIVGIINALVYFKRKRTVFILGGFALISYVLFFWSGTTLDIVYRAKTSFSPSESMSIRVFLWKKYLAEMFSRPFEGYSIDNPYYLWAHNLFLDVYIQNGIVVMFLLILIFIFHYVDVWRVLRIKQNNMLVNDQNKCFWMSVSIALSAAFFTEPVYEAVPILMVYMFVVFACVRKMISTDKLLLA